MKNVNKIPWQWNAFIPLLPAWNYADEISVLEQLQVSRTADETVGGEMITENFKSLDEVSAARNRKVNTILREQEASYHSNFL